MRAALPAVNPIPFREATGCFEQRKIKLVEILCPRLPWKIYAPNTKTQILPNRLRIKILRCYSPLVHNCRYPKPAKFACHIGVVTVSGGPVRGSSRSLARAPFIGGGRSTILRATFSSPAAGGKQRDRFRFQSSCLRPRTSCMSYSPGGCRVTQQAARKAPLAKVSRLEAL